MNKRTILFKPISLRLRLIFFIGLVTVVVLFVFGRYIEHSVGSHFADQDMQELQSTSEALEKLVDKNMEQEKFVLMVDRLLGMQNKVLASVEDDKGNIIFQSDDMSQLNIINKIQQKYPPSIIQADSAGLTWREGDLAYRVYLKRVQNTQGQKFKIVTLMNIHFHDHFLAQFRRSLWWATFFACAVMFGAIWWAIRTGHKPLVKVSQRIQDITSENLNIRLDEDNIPKELEGLIHSFNKMIGNIEEVFIRQSHFSTDIAHELRTPVTNMVTQTQIVLGKNRGAAEYQDALYSNLEELERMARMINDMLFLSRSENNQFMPEKINIDLSSEILALFEYVEPWAEEQNLTLSLSGEAPPVLGDRLMIQRLLNNLLSNAIHYAKPDSLIEVVLSSERDYALLSISNETQEDIAPEHLDRLFERFYRTDASRQNKGAGSGIGLSIVKSIVEIHNGLIWVDYKDRKIMFTVQLPFSADKMK